MTNFRSKLAEQRGFFTAPHLLLITGIFLTALTLVAGGALAASTKKFGVVMHLKVGNEDSDITYANSDFTERSGLTYTVKMQKGKAAEVWTDVAGIPLIDILTKKLTPEQANAVPYIAIFWDKDEPGGVSFIDHADLVDPDHPAMIVTSARRNGNLVTGVPLVVRAQASSNDVNGDEIVELGKGRAGGDNDALTSFGLGNGTSTRSSVDIKKTKRANGEYLFSPVPVKSNFTYRWWINDTAAGESTRIKKTFDTTASQSVWVQALDKDGKVVAAAKRSFTTSLKDDQKTKADKPVGGGGPGDAGGGSGSGIQGSSGLGSGGITSAPTPTSSTSTPSTPEVAPQPLSPVPSGSTGATNPTTAPQAAGTNDKSHVADAAEGLSAKGSLQFISGVALGAPTAGSGGVTGITPLEALSAPAQVLNDTIFNNVNDAGDVWPFMVAILFAVGLSGAIREYVRP